MRPDLPSAGSPIVPAYPLGRRTGQVPDHHRSHYPRRPPGRPGFPQYGGAPWLSRGLAPPVPVGPGSGRARAEAADAGPDPDEEFPSWAIPAPVRPPRRPRVHAARRGGARHGEPPGGGGPDGDDLRAGNGARDGGAGATAALCATAASGGDSTAGRDGRPVRDSQRARPAAGHATAATEHGTAARVACACPSAGPGPPGPGGPGAGCRVGAPSGGARHRRLSTFCFPAAARPRRRGGRVRHHVPARQVPVGAGHLLVGVGRHARPLPAGQAHQGRAARALRQLGNQCDWTLDHKPVYRLLQVTAQAYAPSGLASGNGSATSAAKDAYAQDLQAETPRRAAPISRRRGSP